MAAFPRTGSMLPVYSISAVVRHVLFVLRVAGVGGQPSLDSIIRGRPIMQQMRLSKPPGFQAARSEHVRVEPATNQEQAEQSVVSTGLCSTCNHSTNCTYPRREHLPMMFCEEFDGVARAAPTAAITERLLLAVQDQRICGAEHPSKYCGLCRTCEHREGCTFPKAEGGVWQCEEFL